jgi:hypothetical protein
LRERARPPSFDGGEVARACCSRPPKQVVDGLKPELSCVRPETPEQLSKLLLRCVSHCREERPSFQEIVPEVRRAGRLLPIAAQAARSLGGATRTAPRAHSPCDWQVDRLVFAASSGRRVRSPSQPDLHHRAVSRSHSSKR